MKHYTNMFYNKDEQRIHTEIWLPEAPPTAIILVVHGYAEHIGRYTPVIEQMVQEGYAVYGLDHRGHGKSQGKRVYMETINDLVDDLRQYFEWVREQHPGLPIIILSHSMGTLISLTFALRYQQDLHGLIISGTATNSDEILPSPLVTAMRWLSQVIPTVRLASPGGNDILTRDQAIIQAVEADPLIDKGPWRVGMAYRMIEAGRYIRAHAHELTLPLLILHGEADKLTPISGAQMIFDKASSTDKTIKMYPGMRHEVMNEIGREEVFDDIKLWLKGHLSNVTP
ncbi:alpha/beta hydrolase [Phototrophicus methaneseepsis]|uniref:Monoacylglycerol lipase n=1 Tax=Phototrophicus methaneseepsis TaxID=2710758 RepID=A0A7S8IE57_9CHLR|nr:alpha/beta hydrolase [Phototrophicus methaneseepsis]QPC82227.1 alpha/beta hydrolase [Phototrophicus methaneseepsis]